MKKAEIIAKKITVAKNKKETGRRPVIMANLQLNGDREKIIESGRLEYSYLTDIRSLPEITDHDLIFAKSLHSEYSQIPFESLCWLVRDLRFILKHYREDFKASLRSMDEIFWSKLCSDDMNFKALTFESNNGQISIPADSIVFQFYFLPIVEKLRALRKKTNDAQAKEMTAYMNYVMFMKTWRFFKSLDLGPQQKRISAGMILQHFDLFKLKAQKDWQPDGSYSYYKQYLNDRVKQMLKKIPSKDHLSVRTPIETKNIST